MLLNKVPMFFRFMVANFYLFYFYLLAIFNLKIKKQIGYIIYNTYVLY